MVKSKFFFSTWVVLFLSSKLILQEKYINIVSAKVISLGKEDYLFQLQDSRYVSWVAMQGFVGSFLGLGGVCSFVGGVMYFISPCALN